MLTSAAMQAVANIMVENGCPEGDDAWCHDECTQAGYSDGGSGWLGCLDGCQKEANVHATAFAETLANIDITTNYSCTTEKDIVGTAFVVVDSLLVRSCFFFLQSVAGAARHAIENDVVLFCGAACLD